jgi:hypothetical protein
MLMLSRFLSIVLCALLLAACSSNPTTEPDSGSTGIKAPGVGSRLFYHHESAGRIDTLFADLIATGLEINGKKGVTRYNIGATETWLIATESNGDISLATLYDGSLEDWIPFPIGSRQPKSLPRKTIFDGDHYYERDRTFNYYAEDDVAVKGRMFKGSQVEMKQTERRYSSDGELLDTDTYRILYTWSPELKMLLRWFSDDGAFHNQLINYELK